MLNRDDILGADDMVKEEQLCPEWGGSVFVRTLTGTERDVFEESVNRKRKGEHVDIRGLKVSLLIKVLCDSNGVLLFTPADAPALNKKSAAVLDRLFQAAQRVNGMSKENVEELAGNSESAPSDSSGSDLPE